LKFPCKLQLVGYKLFPALGGIEREGRKCDVEDES
jgi:hypothetical protein